MADKEKIKVGIFFGGPSREREISFAGGRTVYDNLDKSLFTAIPIFVDHQCRFILLDWQFVYKGSIRDFYPPARFVPHSSHGFQIYADSLPYTSPEEYATMQSSIGQPLQMEDLKDCMDVAFLALHGYFGEDGKVQGLLDSLHIPYTGSDILACSLGMDKSVQKKLMETAKFNSPERMKIDREEWLTSDRDTIVKKIVEFFKGKCVVIPSNQGSSIGISIIYTDLEQDTIEAAIDKAFFVERVKAKNWIVKSIPEKVNHLRGMADLREGIGFPLYFENKIIHHPEELLLELDCWAKKHSGVTALLQSFHSETSVLIESFIEGQEFSCIVIKRENGSATALPPTGIIKGQEVFDYRSKYLAGLSRKQTPIDLDDKLIQKIRRECVRLFQFLGFKTYARIDGFIKDDGTIFLNDPNTTSGMLPASFFFHQAAEIGLNPSQFLTFILRTSLQERMRDALILNPAIPDLIHKLDTALAEKHEAKNEKLVIGILMGGYSYERHISVESGRNIYEKLASSSKYHPVPFFLTGTEVDLLLYRIPVNLLLKDNADDIREKVLTTKEEGELIGAIRRECSGVTEKFAGENVIFHPTRIDWFDLNTMLDAMFIALHGRPGEDGTIQKLLEEEGIPYNGSPPESSSITIDKHLTARVLEENGFCTPKQKLIYKSDFLESRNTILESLKGEPGYPMIVKPVDDGCSSAVKVVKNEEALTIYLEAIFRDEIVLDETYRHRLELPPREEFPVKDVVLIENLIGKEGADRFLEITVGLHTSRDEEGQVKYHIFEPSEALSGGEILSLEEKFLAGEGQNITPARFSEDIGISYRVTQIVKDEVKRAAKVLQIEGYARFDAFVRVFHDERVELIFIEANSLPGMTPATVIFHQCALAGLKPDGFIDAILQYALGTTKQPHTI